MIRRLCSLLPASPGARVAIIAVWIFILFILTRCTGPTIIYHIAPGAVEIDAQPPVPPFFRRSATVPPGPTQPPRTSP